LPRPWTGSWTGASDNPRTASAASAMTCAICAASAHGCKWPGFLETAGQRFESAHRSLEVFTFGEALFAFWTQPVAVSVVGRDQGGCVPAFPRKRPAQLRMESSTCGQAVLYVWAGPNRSASALVKTKRADLSQVREGKYRSRFLWLFLILEKGATRRAASPAGPLVPRPDGA
jgi:hypothetical protein